MPNNPCLEGKCHHCRTGPIWPLEQLVLKDLAWMQKYFGEKYQYEGIRYEELEETCDELLNGYIYSTEDASHYGDIYREHYNEMVKAIRIIKED